MGCPAWHQVHLYVIGWCLRREIETRCYNGKELLVDPSRMSDFTSLMKEARQNAQERGEGRADGLVEAVEGMAGEFSYSYLPLAEDHAVSTSSLFYLITWYYEYVYTPADYFFSCQESHLNKHSLTPLAYLSRIANSASKKIHAGHASTSTSTDESCFQWQRICSYGLAFAPGLCDLFSRPLEGVPCLPCLAWWCCQPHGPGIGVIVESPLVKI